ncbi:hypothetical protein [Burkholderia lata]|uniref:hypothetical protein n=1 Tax=Burkholderia lata (strain ATCC 17760 / DSM 23089 / LMG 22485 / NCIMB 9086 / R18194 / 383) TaxID=482957 RepID=UPI0015821D2D|nr:hypothetical protein [Burkholderia lata]
MGLFRWLGVVAGGVGGIRTVKWKPSNAEIWVDTGFGCSKWKEGAFGFADYGLHELWNEAFGGMDIRDHAPVAAKPTGPRKATACSETPSERLIPIEVIGERYCSKIGSGAASRALATMDLTIDIYKRTQMIVSSQRVWSRDFMSIPYMPITRLRQQHILSNDDSRCIA